MSGRKQHGPEDFAPDCVMPGEKRPAVEEQAYRRGYQQGASHALHALKEGARFEAVWKWAHVTLHRWRFKRRPWLKDVLYPTDRPPVPPEGAETGSGNRDAARLT